MALLETPADSLGMSARDFKLTGIDGRVYTLKSLKRDKGFVVMFICNHCPYVQAIAPRLATDMQVLLDAGIGVIAINANDGVQYPADNVDNMKLFAAQHNFPFPYVVDDTQETAKKYGAICTPDFFGFNAQGRLQYRGRLDASRAAPAPENAPRELVDAMLMIAETGTGPVQQNPSMGCSIKWKQDTAA